MKNAWNSSTDTKEIIVFEKLPVSVGDLTIANAVLLGDT
jgi:hypothetical protein